MTMQTNAKCINEYWNQKTSEGDRSIHLILLESMASSDLGEGLPGRILLSVQPELSL